MKTKRQLAAILFADIQGYTALMQSNEPQALAALHKFKTELETQVPQHQGEIIQFYGDGCLVVFNSSVDAVTCAKKLQLAFQSAPKVPVRIGLHAGDVVFKEDNVFGDAVNIASRVESMGISGAVLLSSNVRNQIKNQPEFDLVSLGEFEFKNVEEGMTVYALQGEGLAIPKKGEIKGKLKEVTKAKPKRHWIWLLPSLLILGIGGLFLWNNKANTNKFQPEILKERIAVIPFENNTNNPDLDNLGVIAADWLNKKFMDLEEAEVVSNFTIRTHRDAIGIMENDPQGRPSFAQLTGAKNLITGSFFQEKDHLVFKLEIVDALQGKLRFPFDLIQGQASDKQKLLTELGEQVTGYWVARNLVDTKKINAPKFEAYEAYWSSFQNVQEGIGYLKSLAIDSSFYLPRLHFLNINRGEIYGKNTPHFEFLERHHINLSEYEKAWFYHLKGLYLGDIKTAFNSINELRKKYPTDFTINTVAAAMAHAGLNNSELALEIFNELPLENTPIKNIGSFYHFRIEIETYSLLQLNRLAESEIFLNSVKPNPNSEQFHYLLAIMYESIVSKKAKKIEEAYSNLENDLSSEPNQFLVQLFILQNSNLITNEFRFQILSDIKAVYSSLPANDIGRILWHNAFAWVEKKPAIIRLDNLEQLPKAYQIINLRSAGQLYVETNQTNQVDFIIEKLKKLTTPDYTVPSHYGCAFAFYTIGQLQAQMGQYDKAIQNLSKARNLGIETYFYQFEYDRYLAPLYEMPEFQELLKPIWPEIKD